MTYAFDRSLQTAALKLELESTGYSALPSPPRLMRHAVDTWYKRLGGHTHSVTALRRASQYLHSLSGDEDNKLVLWPVYIRPHLIHYFLIHRTWVKVQTHLNAVTALDVVTCKIKHLQKCFRAVDFPRLCRGRKHVVNRGGSGTSQIGANRGSHNSS